jgi:hypothetical protein
MLGIKATAQLDEAVSDETHGQVGERQAAHASKVAGQERIHLRFRQDMLGPHPLPRRASRDAAPHDLEECLLRPDAVPLRPNRGPLIGDSEGP